MIHKCVTEYLEDWEVGRRNVVMFSFQIAALPIIAAMTSPNSHFPHAIANVQNLSLDLGELNLNAIIAGH